MFGRVEAFVRDVRELQTEEALAGALAHVSRDLGFRYFALTHHLDVRRSSAAIRIHNYPEGWAEWFDDGNRSARRIRSIQRATSPASASPGPGSPT